MTTPAEMITLAHGIRFQSSPWTLGLSIALVLLVVVIRAVLGSGPGVIGVAG